MNSKRNQVKNWQQQIVELKETNDSTKSKLQPNQKRPITKCWIEQTIQQQTQASQNGPITTKCWIKGNKRFAYRERTDCTNTKPGPAASVFSAWHHPYTGKRPGGRRQSATWCCCAGQKQNQYNGGVHLASILRSTDAWSVLLRAVYAMNVYLCCVFLLCLGTSGKGDIQRNFLVSSVCFLFFFFFFFFFFFLFSFFFLYFCALIGT